MTPNLILSRFRVSLRKCAGLRAVVLVLCASWCAADGACEANQAATVASADFLAAGDKRIRCDFVGGNIDQYQLVLDGSQLLRIVVDQRGIDVELRLRDPDGEVLFDRDGLTGPVGEEQLLWVIDDFGRHQLEVMAFETAEPAGCYEISYEVSDSVTPRDRELALAAKSLAYAINSSRTRSEAVPLLEKFLASSDTLGQPAWQVEALISLGNLYFESKPAEALTLFNKALEKSTPGSVTQAYIHTRLGDLHREIFSDLESSRTELLAAMKVWEERYGARHYEAYTAQHLGYVYHLLGEFHNALFFYNKAITLSGNLGQYKWESTGLHNRGWIHYYLSKMDQAHADFSRSMEIKEERGMSELSTTMTALSYIHTHNGDYGEALRILDRALRLRGEDARGRAVTQTALGWALHKSGKPDEALRVYREALEVFRKLEDKDTEANVLRRIGLIQEELGDDHQAMSLYSDALSKLSSTNLDARAETFLGIARINLSSGKAKEALRVVDDAIDIIEMMRKMPFDPQLRSDYFASKQHFFEFKINLLMELHESAPSMGYDINALTVSEQARARSLLETLNDGGVNLRARTDQALLDREEKIIRKIKTKLYQTRQKPDLLWGLRAEIESLEQEHGRILAEIRKNHPFYASIAETKPLKVKELQERSLDEDTLMLEYYFSDKKSFLWALTSDTVHSFVLEADPREIEESARQVYRLLPVGRQRKYRRQLEWELARLSERLLGPVVEELTKKKKLLVVCDGALQYVPFAAMPLPGESPASGWPARLVTRYEIVTLPSASTLAILRHVGSKRNRDGDNGLPATAVVLADPVFNGGDERVAENGFVTRGDDGDSFQRLKYSEMEAKIIQRFLPDARVATGFDANKEFATSDELLNYRYIHFATHGIFDAQFPERSGLIFSLFDREGRPQDGILHLPEIYGLGLAADLVVLSACQTALGEEIRGEGLVGLTQGFMYSGAPRVMASLWNVLDESTAALMQLFYRRLLEESRSPAAALRLAQVDFLREHPEWSEPYHWAGFILQGDF